MSRAERSLAVKAPTVTAPPCGICLHQQLCTMSVAVEAGDDCVFCLYWTSQYFTLSPSLPSQTKMLFKKKKPKKTQSSSSALSFSPQSLCSQTPLPSQSYWLSSSRLLRNAGHFQFFPFAFKRAPPLTPHLLLLHSLLTTPYLSLSWVFGSWGGGGG